MTGSSFRPRVLRWVARSMIVAGRQWERVAGRRALSVIPHSPGRHVDTGTGWHGSV